MIAVRTGMVLVIAAVATTACVQRHYEWGGYDEALYRYYKDPAQADSFAEKLSLAIAQGETSGKIAPGLHAEYGYLLLAQGRSNDAVEQFETEKRHWPEAKVLMDRMITLARTGNGKKTADKAQ